MRYLYFTFLTLILFVLAPLESFAQTQQAAQHKAGDIAIEEAEAPAPVTGEKVPVDFGTLYVPENRANSSGRLIEIAFLRFKSTSRNPSPL